MALGPGRKPKVYEARPGVVSSVGLESGAHCEPDTVPDLLKLFISLNPQSKSARKSLFKFKKKDFTDEKI